MIEEKESRQLAAIGLGLVTLFSILFCVAILSWGGGIYLFSKSFSTLQAEAQTQNAISYRTPTPTSLALSAQSGVIATRWANATLVAEERFTQTAVATINMEETPTLSVPVLEATLLPLPNEIISSNNAGRIIQLARWAIGPNRGNDIVFLPDNSTLVNGISMDAVEFRNILDGRVYSLLDEDRSHTQNRSTNVAVSPNGEYLAAEASSLHLWTLSDKTLLNFEPRNEVSNLGIVSLAFSPNNSQFAYGWSNGVIHLVDLSNLAMQIRLIGHTDDAISVSYSPDGSTLASASLDKTIRFWNTKNGDNLDLITLDAQVTAVEFSPDGKFLVSGDIEGNTIVWDANYRTQLISLPHGGRINFLTFSPDGQLLATASADKSIRLWRVSDWQLVAELTGHTRAVYSLDFSPDGRLLASQGEEGTIRIWGVWP